jgi:hypothetical protein
MSKYNILTKYINTIPGDNLGEWLVDMEKDGISENTIKFPFVQYSEMVNNFVNDFYIFEENNKDMGLNRYQDILKNNDLEFDVKSMISVDVSDLNAQCVLALIMGAIRADRFSEGTLLEFLNNGCILIWLKRLDNIE